MKSEIIFPLIYMICLLILIGPRFIDMTSNFRQFLSNLSILSIATTPLSSEAQQAFEEVSINFEIDF